MTTPRCLPRSHQVGIRPRFTEEGARRLSLSIRAESAGRTGADGLSVSPTDYCGMLHQTVAAAKSILPDVTANDPALLTSTRAFLAEFEAVAPRSVAGPLQVLGHAVITFVESGGDSTAVKTVDAAAVRKAASTVAADAKHSCGVDLS